jgi:hypothetical protein
LGNSYTVNSFSDEDYYSGELYYITDKKSKFIADNIISGVISGNGQAIAYMDKERNVFSYNTDSDAASRISSNASLRAISPDGETIVFATGDATATGDETRELFSYVNGVISKIGDDLHVIAVSDKGEYIYGLDDEKMYLLEPGEAPRLLASNCTTDDYMNFGFILNQSHTQLIFAAGGDSYYVKEGVCEKIASYRVRLGYAFDVPAYCKNLAFTYPVDNLLNRVFVGSNGELTYIDENKSTRILAKNTSDIKVGVNGEELYYKENNRLFRIELGSDITPERVSENTEEYIISEEDDLYIRNSRGELYWTRKASLIPNAGQWSCWMRVAEDATPDFDVTTGNWLIYSSDTSLMKFKAGLTEMIADEVKWYRTYPTLQYYMRESTTEGYRELYLSSDGEIFDNVSDGSYTDYYPYADDKDLWYSGD